jgi:hypothetical protein
MTKVYYLYECRNCGARKRVEFGKHKGSVVDPASGSVDINPTTDNIGSSTHPLTGKCPRGGNHDWVSKGSETINET